ncbi:MAG: DUF11 domain-containing protein [Candidatus Aquicultorales bacterium]
MTSGFRWGVQDEKGAVTVIVTFALVALVLSLAIVIDVGLLFQERRQLQTATDAAALAAAMDVSEGMGTDQAVAKAKSYVAENANVPPTEVTVSFPQGDRVKVVARTTRGLYFAGIVTKGSAPVRSQSTAALGSAQAVANLAPFIVPLQRVPYMIGEENMAAFELGEDRPLEEFSKIKTVAGDSIDFTITYNNTGPKVVTAEIRDPIPDGTVYVGGSASEGGSYSPSAKEVTWTFPSVPPGEYRIARFTVKATSISPSSVSNTAYLNTGGGRTISATADAGPQKGYFWLTDFNEGSGGIPQYDAWIRKGYPGYVYAGDIANGTGMKVSLKDALAWRKDFDPRITVPLYSYTEGGGRPGKYHVVGFAQFVVVDFNLTSQPKTITGYFTDGAVVKGIYGGPPEGYFGIDTIWLVD